MNNRKKVATIVAFFAIVVIWVLVDQLAKSRFAGMVPNGILAGPFAGIFDIRLVHNTGGAWGIFSENTMMLGVFSLVVCVALLVFFFATLKQANWLQTVAIALVVGGGIGNAIDRFLQGYVTDFIEFSFIDFPVFNIADIGVTCGVALLVASLLVEWRKESRLAASELAHEEE